MKARKKTDKVQKDVSELLLSAQPDSNAPELNDYELGTPMSGSSGNLILDQTPPSAF